jgi:hypothetical protein
MFGVRGCPRMYMLARNKCYRALPPSLRSPTGTEFCETTNLRDTLLVLPPEENRPGDPTRVLALQEEALALAVLESEDLAVTADVELALFAPSVFAQ